MPARSFVGGAERAQQWQWSRRACHGGILFHARFKERRLGLGIGLGLGLGLGALAHRGGGRRQGQGGGLSNGRLGDDAARFALSLRRR